MWHGILGIIAFPLIAWALSENRRGVDVKAAIIGIALQLVLAGLLLGIPPIKHAFLALNNVVLIIVEATRAGTSFVFGYLGGGQLPFEVTGAGTTFNLAFQALPLILVMSALAALLFYWRVLPSSSKPQPGSCNGRYAWAARSALVLPQTYSSGWSRARFWSGLM